MWLTISGLESRSSIRGLLKSERHSRLLMVQVLKQCSMLSHTQGHHFLTVAACRARTPSC
jgi:hypothetical protein